MSIQKLENNAIIYDPETGIVPQSADIYTALAKSQLEFEAATKNAANPHLKSKYANLQSYLDEARPVLAKHGIAIVQTARTEKLDAVLYAGVRTVLVHSSGQSIDCGELMLPVATPNAQGIGSSLTYARRYALASCLALSADDDDGHAASTKVKAKAAVESDASLVGTLESSVDFAGEMKAFKERAISAKTKGELNEAWNRLTHVVNLGMPREWLGELTALKDKRKAEL